MSSEKIVDNKSNNEELEKKDKQTTKDGVCPWCKNIVKHEDKEKHNEDCFYRPRGENERNFGKGLKT